jgi:hypothetical protein
MGLWTFLKNAGSSTMDRTRHTKEAALLRLSEHGLAVPKSLVTSRDEISDNLQAYEPNEHIYIRTIQPEMTEPGKVCLPVQAYSWARTVAENGDMKFLLQPFQACQLGGAILATPTVIYVEVAQGLPLGLLRKGELTMALLQSRDAAVYKQSAQEHQWILGMEGIKLARAANPPLDALAVTCAAVANEISDSELHGLFEFGILDSRTIFFDYKSVTAVPTFLSKGIRYGTSQITPFMTPPDALTIPLPDLKYWPVVRRQKCARILRGARLSHLSTYSLVATEEVGLEFVDW